MDGKSLLYAASLDLVNGIWRNTVGCAVEAVHGANYRVKHPIKTDSEGYVLQDDAPLFHENDHTRVRKSNGFVVAGRNESSVIEGLEGLIGFSIKELERRMYPDDQTFDQIAVSGYLGSNPVFGGFLKEGEKLIPILVADNDSVLSQGLTHQDVARPLLFIYNIMYRTRRNPKFIYNGVKFEIRINPWPMGQMSPFSNKLVVPAMDVYVRKVGTDEELMFSTIHPFMIHGFGFYEGDVKYRIEPWKIIDFFSITS